MRGRTIACLLLSPLLPVLLLAVLLPAGTPRGMPGCRSAGHVNAMIVTLSAPDGGEAIAGDARRPAVAPTQAVDAASDPLRTGGIGDGEDEDGVYLPVTQMTERPQLLQDIVPDWHAQDRRPQRMACTLLVSEYGDVDRVLCDDPVIAPAMLQAVGERFRAARFAPGRLYGRPVRSALRIELRLD